VERLAGLFGVSREEQDRFALRSHRLAVAAWEEGAMSGEVMPVPVPPRYEIGPERDGPINTGVSNESLGKAIPVFDSECGTITAVNSAPDADGAVALVLASGERVSKLKLPALGKVVSWAATACGPENAGLEPVFSAAAALDKADGLSLERMARVEIDEAYAAQVLTCLRAFSSVEFCNERLGRPALGEIDPDRVNVNGGAIAIGRPVAATGARMVLALLREMERSDLSHGLAAIGAASGQGGALVMERS
jgi:acetyl-CoA acetyltransferase family protein